MWRAVDQEGMVIDGYVKKRRNKRAALKFLRKSLKKYGATKQIVTDKLASYRADLKELNLAHIKPTTYYTLELTIEVNNTTFIRFPVDVSFIIV